MGAVMSRLPRVLSGALTGLCLGAALFAAPAHAGLFDDDEARKAILDLRARIEQGNELQRTRSAEQTALLTEQINTLKRSLLDLNNQIEQLRGDNAKLRGQNEQLARDLSEVQRLQKDMQAGVDDRLRKMEPQKVSLVEKGMLKGLLYSRQPVRGHEGSNGHGRMPGNFGTASALPTNMKFLRPRATILSAPSAGLLSSRMRVSRNDLPSAI